MSNLDDETDVFVHGVLPCTTAHFCERQSRHLSDDRLAIYVYSSMENIYNLALVFLGANLPLVVSFHESRRLPIPIGTERL